jgi:hypothetical protein
MGNLYYEVKPVWWADTKLDAPAMERLEELLLAFNADLESWFSADVACCDSCHDDFVAKWPLVYQRDPDFGGIGLDTFYSGSRRVRAEFGKAEFCELIRFAECPRCQAALSDNVWPYGFAFSVPTGFEEDLVELARIASSTPFLVLENPFARHIRDEVRGFASTLDRNMPVGSVFRGRCWDQMKAPLSADFLPPPPDATREGRYNHAGKPVLYTSSDPETCFEELRRPTKPLYIARLRLKKELRLLDFHASEEKSDLLTALFTSSILSGPGDTDGWNQPQYILSRFVADCTKAAGLDGIGYPSVRQAKGYNIAVLHDAAWSDIVEVEEILLHDRAPVRR